MRLFKTGSGLCLIRKLARAAVIVAVFWGGIVHSQQDTDTGLLIVMDYSGSMWAEADPRRSARGDPNSHFSFHDKAEIYAENLLKARLNAKFSGPTRFVTFGENKTGDCSDITLQSGLGDRLNEAMISQVKSLFRRTRPLGTTPLEQSLERAIDESAAIIEGGKTERMQIVAVTDMKDICKGGQPVSNPTKQDLCDLGKNLQRSLDRVNIRISERRQIENAVGIEFFVAINPANNSGQTRPLEVIAECMDNEKRPVVVVPKDETPDQRIVEPPTPTKPLTLEVLGEPVQSVDAFGRVIDLLPGELQLRQLASGVTDRKILPADGQTLLGRPGTVISLDLVPKQGVVQNYTHQFSRDSTKIFDLRLPRISLQLLDSKGNPMAGRVNWQVSDVNTPSLRAEWLRSTSQAVFELPSGHYEFSASQIEGAIALLRLVVQRNDLQETLRPAEPERPTKVELPIVVNRTNVGLALGSPPPVDLVISSASGEQRFGETVGQVTLHVGQAYDVSARLNEEVIVNQEVVLQNDLIVPNVSIQLAPARILASDFEGGLWRVERLDANLSGTLQGTNIDLTIFPGRYQVSIGGRDFCPKGQGLDLGYGEVAVLNDSITWPARDVCQ